VDELPYSDSDGREWELKAIHYQGEGPQGKHAEWAWLVSADLIHKPGEDVWRV
jgi:hypothetical protein